MSLQNDIIGLINSFSGYLDTKKEIFKSFSAYGIQVEGWLKGELIYFLDKEKREKRIKGFDREIPSGQGRKKVDIQIETFSGKAWIELKHWLIGKQRRSNYTTTFYFPDARLGIKSDVEKLIKIKDDEKYLIILATENPGKDNWDNGIKRFNDKFRPLHIESINTPTDFENKPYYLGLLKIKT